MRFVRVLMLLHVHLRGLVKSETCTRACVAVFGHMKLMLNSNAMHVQLPWFDRVFTFACNVCTQHTYATKVPLVPR